MTISIRIPTIMRTHSAGQAIVECEGTTVGEVLFDLVNKYPSINSVLFQSDGELHRYMNIYLDSDDIRYIGSLDAQVSNSKEITILPAVAGGMGNIFNAS